MRALCYHGPRNIRCETRPDPVLESDRDAIVRMTACSICGSDLHIYAGHGFSNDVGFCVGHEAVGEVIDVGRNVQRVKPGDRVMLPAAVGCGICRPCLSGVVQLCERPAANCYGLSNALQGVQSEAIRVPAADMNAVRIPDGISDDAALMMTDALATAWFGARWADVKPGTTVAVIGLGPIGLMAVDCAYLRGATVVFGIDPVEERRQLAAQSGAVPLAPNQAIEAIREATGGRKLQCVIEAAGLDATVDLALRIVAPRATVCAIGAQQTRRYAFPLERAFAAGLTFRTGTCSIPEELPTLFPLVQSGRLKPERYITHRLKLEEGAKAYRLFDAREDGTLKIVLTPE